MSGFLAGQSGGLTNQLKTAAGSLLIQQLLKHAGGGSTQASGVQGGGLGGLLGGLLGGGTSSPMAGGPAGGGLGTSTDIHELRELQGRQRVLVAELQHRTHNLITVVRSTADKTVRASADLGEFRAAFRDRLDALARVQGLLSRLEENDCVTFDELIGAEMAALDGAAERVLLDGPTGIRLRSSMVQTLAMALHELATNAVKYGALRQPQARLAVSWAQRHGERDGEPWLHINWRKAALPCHRPAPGLPGLGRAGC